MIVHRVFPFLSTARVGGSGHPMYLHRPQGRSRVDNPGEYEIWYFALQPEAAVGEVRGDFSVWRDDTFATPFLPGGRLALGRYSLPDDLPLLDLDDAQNLLDRGLRPTQVIARNRPTTQAWALRIFREQNPDGSRRWAGVRWWSFQRPHWTVFALWVPAGEPPAHEFIDADDLYVSHPAVVDAARSLVRSITP